MMIKALGCRPLSAITTWRALSVTPQVVSTVGFGTSSATKLQAGRNRPNNRVLYQAYEQLKLAFTYLYTTPGIPLIYYGDEFGLPGAGDPDNRRMMRFDGALSTFESQTLEWMKQLGQLRAKHPALRAGAWSPPLWKEADFLAWSRSLDKDLVIVLIHRGDAQLKKGTLSVPAVADGTALVEWFSGKKMVVNQGKLPFEIAARSAQVWTAQP
ncbi:MAG TPA: hypothetical protein DCQ06_04300 [Myxococcales bacterium]|nr:hypothetical protein [Myxococcales bacterium]